MNHDVEVVGWGEENGLKYLTHNTTRSTAQHSGVGDSEVCMYTNVLYLVLLVQRYWLA